MLASSPLKFRVEQLTSISLDVCRFLLQEKDLPSLLQGVCDRLLELKLNRAAWLVLIDHELGGVITAESGLGKRFEPVVAQLREGELPHCGALALARDNQMALVCNNSNCALAEALGKGHFDQVITVPIRCSKTLTGFFAVQLPIGAVVNEAELDLFKELGRSLSLALRQLFAFEEIKQREATLQLAEERYELALDASQAGLWDWNIQTGEMYTSSDQKMMVDYRNGNGTPSPPDRIIHPEDKVKVMEILNDHLAGKTEEYRIEYRIKDKNSQWAWFLDRGRVVERDEKNMPVRMTGTHQNISHQKRKDQALAAIQKQLHDAVAHERTFLQTVIDGAGDPVMAIDLDYNLLLINTTAAQLVRGAAGSRLQGEKCYRLFHGSDNPCDDEGFPCPVRAARESGDRLKLLHNPYHGNGINNTFELDVSLLYDQEGNLTGVIEVARDITDRLRIEKELRDSESRLHRLAHHDTLTGLPNRLLFKDRLNQAVVRAKRKRSMVALLFLDLDRFKQINDTLGHDVGDALLIEVAKRLQQQCRQSDTVARIGGDEFVFVLDDISCRENVAVVAEKIMGSLTELVLVHDHALQVSTSIGISLFSEDAADIERLIKSADLALYKAKEEGRSNYQFYHQSLQESSQ